MGECKRCEEISGEYDPGKGKLQQLWRFIVWLVSGGRNSMMESQEARGGRVPGQLTWTCHVCKKERPDNKISVKSRDVCQGGVTITENIRYCNDNEECFKGVEQVHFIQRSKGGKSAD